MNASDDDVHEVFVRINSYAVPVTEAELRNARFDNDFSDNVKELVQSQTKLWNLGIVSDRDRVRMVDQSVIGELFAFAERGVTDGAEGDITKFYESVRQRPSADLPSRDLLIELIEQAVPILSPFAGEPLVERPHFLMLMAALMCSRGVLPPGKLRFDALAAASSLLTDSESVVASLSALNGALASDASGGRFELFRDARATTQRMRSRQVRFDHFVRALAGEFAD
jgi:hypothetical protein